MCRVLENISSGSYLEQTVKPDMDVNLGVGVSMGRGQVSRDLIVD